ncbi:uncharacterized protein [Bemisia tabaci]|uniref:uncharacterized protein n=1 Tax=Bemisia tabaci TaxID=7038 RepID=UPI003B2873AC
MGLPPKVRSPLRQKKQASPTMATRRNPTPALISRIWKLRGSRDIPTASSREHDQALTTRGFFSKLCSGGGGGGGGGSQAPVAVRPDDLHENPPPQQIRTTAIGTRQRGLCYYLRPKNWCKCFGIV